MYNTVVNATDVNDVRLAPGYPQANTSGTSCGTRFSLDLIRDYAAAGRSISFRLRFDRCSGHRLHRGAAPS